MPFCVEECKKTERVKKVKFNSFILFRFRLFCSLLQSSDRIRRKRTTDPPYLLLLLALSVFYCFCGSIICLWSGINEWMDGKGSRMNRVRAHRKIKLNWMEFFFYFGCVCLPLLMLLLLATAASSQYFHKTKINFENENEKETELIIIYLKNRTRRIENVCFISIRFLVSILLLHFTSSTYYRLKIRWKVQTMSKCFTLMKMFVLFI